MNAKRLIAYIPLLLIMFFAVQKMHAQEPIPGVSYYYTDFSDGALPEDWSPSVPGYNARISENTFELSISKSAGGDHYTLGNLFVEDFDLRPYLTISYRSVDTIQMAIRIFEPSGSISPQEIFTLPAAVEWTSYTLNLSTLSSESWGYDLDSIQLVFQPGNSEYTGTIGLDEIMIGDTLNGKTFMIGLDQSSPFSVNLGNDTTIKAPEILMLDAGNPGKEYLWSNGETEQTIVVDTSGTYHVTVIGVNNCTLTDSIHVTLDLEDGIIDQNAGLGLNIYPNPAQSLVIVEVSEHLIGFELLILDISGRVLESKILPGKLNIQNISNYPRGLYFVGISGKLPYTKLYKN